MAMSKIISLLIVVVAVVGAGFAAMTMRGGGKSASSAGEVEHAVAHTEEELGYFAFQRPFLVPIVEDRTVRALAVLRLTLEMPNTEIEFVRTKEPRLRDAMMRTLFALANEGYLGGDITDTETYEEIQGRLLTASRSLIDESVEEVLIVDFNRQEN